MSEKEKFKEVKKSNGGIVLLSVLFIVVILAFVGYVLLDQGIIKLNVFNNDVEEKEEMNPEKKELDINSRLVQKLYDSVGVNKEDGWHKYWAYSGDFNAEIKDFYAKSSSEQIKMNIVGVNLSAKKRNYVNCDANVPEKNDYGYSVCSGKTYNGGLQYAYDREYVEMIYKSIFGKDAKLDTSVSILEDRHALYSYSYVQSLDAYVMFVAVGGDVAAPGGYYTSLKSAVQEGKQVLIYEAVRKDIYNYEGALVSTENFEMVYTFELEDDGMYKFVSRVKKDK